MEGEREVTLHGTWASAFSKRVELALKIKGIPYGFVEEDLANKSPVLLKYNSIHKKVPVLVHNGKPIVESSVILQYIDETWRVAPHLLPDDPYKRAKVRFWVSFIQQQLFEAMRRLILLDGELQQEAIQEVMDRMKVLEEGMKEFFPGGIGKMETTKLGLLDILVTATFGSYKVYEEVIGAQILVPEKNPLIHSWVMALNELPVVQELKPPYDKLVTVVQNYRQNALKSSK